MCWTHPVMAWLWKWSKCWFHTPHIAALLFFSHHFVKVHLAADCSLCLWMGFCLSGPQTHQPEGFAPIAAKEHERWPLCSLPACSVCHLRCQDSPLSSFSHGHSSRATSLVQEPHLLCQILTTRRPRHNATPHTLLCLGNDRVGAHVGCCVGILWGWSCGWLRGSGSGSA